MRTKELPRYVCKAHELFQRGSSFVGVARADPAGSDGSTQQRQNYVSHPVERPKLSSLDGMELVYALKLMVRRGT